MSEQALKQRVMRMLKKEYPHAWLWKISDKFYSGVPDFFVLLPNRPIFLELKTAVGKVTKLQEHTIKEIRKRGIEAHVARSVTEVRQIIEKGEIAYVANNK